MSNRLILMVRPQNIYCVQNYPPLGLILVGTALSCAGYDVEILINDGKDGFDRAVLEKAKDALFVGITANTAEIQDAIRIAGMLRKAYGKGLPLVWGGWHTTLFPEQMEKSEMVDFAVTGEGEAGILQIAGYLDSNNHRLDGKIIRNPFIEIDRLAPPRYELVSNIDSFISRPLTDIFQAYYKGSLRWLPYESSRGCPYTCAFCINVVTQNSQYRAKSPQKVATELAEIVAKYQLNHIKVIDDFFFLQIRRVRQIFEYARSLGVKYTWDAECRADFIREGLVDDEMMAFLKEHGLVQLTFGIESGSIDSLRRMQKRGLVGPEQAISAIEMCSKHGIASRGSFLLDIPGDSRQDIMETISLIRKLRKYPGFTCGVHTYRPYPKSALCEQLIKEGRFYQPDSLEGWNDEYIIRQYTDTAIVRRWQANHNLSSKVSFYESLESSFWIKPHQIRNLVARFINAIFIKIARIRNTYRCYLFSADRWLYILFKDICIRLFIYK